MLNANLIEQHVIWACTQEVMAPKPGNVNGLSDAHDMTVNDFISSAHAIAPIMAQSTLSTGQMIFNAVEATQATVNTNTNLGIVLLFAPLCKAITQCQHINELPAALSTTLNALTVHDAELAYQAIQLANAGGLGKSDEQDVSTTPTITLKQAMELAKERDSIAAQYAHNYRDIFAIGLPNLTFAINCGESVEWATAFAYLKLLSEIPDSLIRRKRGLACAKKVMNKSKNLVQKVNKNKPLSQFETDITLWDTELKQNAINPGTTADMAATSLLLYAFSQTHF